VSQIEVELRGMLTSDEFKRVQKYLESKSTSCQADNKTTYFFVTHGVILKVTDEYSNNKAKITIKAGDETISILKEYEIGIPRSSVEDAVFLFKSLGYSKINHIKQVRINYSYKFAEIALKHTPDWGFHFEIEAVIEAVTDAEAKANRLKQKLYQLCDELDIVPMTPKQIKEKIEDINKSHSFI